MGMARIALGESASAFCSQPLLPQPPITTTHQRPLLSQRGMREATFKDHPTFAARPQLTIPSFSKS
jgi:hypothetical protein